jgi:hypothetical protein
LQLDLFRPIEHGYEYKAIAINKTGGAADVLLSHNGHGSREKLFGEAKQHAALDLISTRRLVGNQVFTLAGILAHNLCRELQMATRPAVRGDLEKRPAKWEFESLGTIRQHLLHIAGTLTRPQGELTLICNVRVHCMHHQRSEELRAGIVYGIRRLHVQSHEARRKSKNHRPITGFRSSSFQRRLIREVRRCRGGAHLCFSFLYFPSSVLL